MATFSAFDGRLAPLDGRGITRVRWSPSVVARLVRRVSRVGSGDHGVRLELRYSDHDVSDTWVRSIGRRTVTTRCWIDGDRFIEQFGSFAVISDVQRVGTGIKLEQVRAELLGFRLPSRLCPQLATRSWRTAGGDTVSSSVLRSPRGRVWCRTASVLRSSEAVWSTVAPIPSTRVEMPPAVHRTLQLAS